MSELIYENSLQAQRNTKNYLCQCSVICVWWGRGADSSHLLVMSVKYHFSFDLTAFCFSSYRLGLICSCWAKEDFILIWSVDKEPKSKNKNIQTCFYWINTKYHCLLHELNQMCCISTSSLFSCIEEQIQQLNGPSRWTCDYFKYITVQIGTKMKF